MRVLAPVAEMARVLRPGGTIAVAVERRDAERQRDRMREAVALVSAKHGAPAL